jgi:hypothetical protein
MPEMTVFFPGPLPAQDIRENKDGSGNREVVSAIRVERELIQGISRQEKLQKETDYFPFRTHVAI